MVFFPKKRVGKSDVTVKIETAHSPALQQHRYWIQAIGACATLADSEYCCVIAILKMLKEHVNSDKIHVTEVQLPSSCNNVGITRPATSPDVTPTENQAQVLQDTQEPRADGVDEEDDELEMGPAAGDDKVDGYELTSDHIEFICGSLVGDLKHSQEGPHLFNVMNSMIHRISMKLWTDFAVR